MKLFFSRLLSSRRAIKRCIHECTEIFVAFYPRKNSASGIDELKSRYCVQRVIEIIVLITVFSLFFFFSFCFFFFSFFHITIFPYTVFQIQFSSFVEWSKGHERWISSLSKITFVVALYIQLYSDELTTLRENGICSNWLLLVISQASSLAIFQTFFAKKLRLERFYYKNDGLKIIVQGPR